jgi:hypothetical protein
VLSDEQLHQKLQRTLIAETTGIEPRVGLIDRVYRELGAGARPDERRLRPRRRRATARFAGTAGIVVGIAVTLAIAGGLIVLLSHPAGRSPVTATRPASVSPNAERSTLLKSLSLLRSHQTAADRHAGLALGAGGLLPPQVAGTTRAAGPICRESQWRAPGCATRVDRSLIRRVVIADARATAVIVPVRAAHVPGISRGTYGLVFALKAPGVGSTMSSLNGGGDTGEAVSTVPLTSIPEFEQRGAIASYDVTRPGHRASNANRIAILVPDGVTSVTLADLSLANALSGKPVRHLETLAGPVHHNIALLQIDNLALARLGHAVHQAAVSDNTEERRGCLLARSYSVRATAQLHWQRNGHTSRTSEVSLFLYVNATPTKPKHSCHR